MSEKTVTLRLDRDTAEALQLLQQRLKTDRSKAIKTAIKNMVADADTDSTSLSAKVDTLVATCADLLNVTVQQAQASLQNAADSKKWLLRTTAFSKAIAEKTQAKELATQFYAEWQAKEGK